MSEGEQVEHNIDLSDVVNATGLKGPVEPAADTYRARVERAMREVQRDLFLSSGEDAALTERMAVMAERIRLSPRAVEMMLEAASIPAGGRVLELGVGYGYLTALLSRLCERVYVLEADPALAKRAEGLFAAQELGNVTVIVGDIREGLPEEAPFDGIVISGRNVQLPDGLGVQLHVDRHMLMFVEQDRTQRILTRLTRLGEEQFVHENMGEVPVTTDLDEILVELGMLRPEVAERLKRRAEEEGRTPEELLLSETVVVATDLVMARAIKYGLKYTNVDALRQMADRGVIHAVSEAFIQRTRLMPLTLSMASLVVVTTDPHASIDEVNRVFRAPSVELYLVSDIDFRRLWASVELERIGGDLDIDASDPERRTRSIELLEALLLEAAGERASDIHLERFGDVAQVRLRVDGALWRLNGFRLNVDELAGVVNVLKINAGMDITEQRRPQGGRFTRRVSGVDYTLRVETQPSLDGEHAIIRMLRQHNQVLSIEQLGFPAEAAERYRRLLRSPGGLMLVVGPTGSGKTTTLYAGLQRLAQDAQRKVITVEDPIEYSFTGIQQTQVNELVQFTFSNALRHLVRQDPDVIVLGEIRDTDTARETIRASQTGHLVLSTLHSNQAVGAIQRLRDLDMHPNSISGELLAVIAQRLARRVCEGCRVKDEAPPRWILDELFPEGVPEAFVAYRGRGCARCSGHGTFGRIAVVEFLDVAMPVRRAIAADASTDELRSVAQSGGWLVSMRDSAIEHVKQGRMPLSEVPRIIGREWMSPIRDEPEA